MDLPERQVRMLEGQLVRTPAVRLLRCDKLDDFHCRAGDRRHLAILKEDMFVARFDHRHSFRSALVQVTALPDVETITDRLSQQLAVTPMPLDKDCPVAYYMQHATSSIRSARVRPP